MAERIPFFNFGASDVAFYDRNGVCKAHLRVIADVDGGFSASTTEVEGGTKNFPWAVTITGSKGTIKLKCREHNPDILAISLGGTLTTHTPGDGAITNTANHYGTTVISSAGLASITVKSASKANLKPGLYFGVMTTSSTMDIYASTDQFITDGTDVVFGDDAKVTSSSITIPSTPSATVDCDELGITLTRGTGSMSMTQGHACRFFVIPVYTYATEVLFGQATPVYNDYTVIISGERSMHDGVQDLVMAVFYSCKVYGGNIKFTRKGYAESEIEITPQYSTANDAVGFIKTIRT